jgi:DNA repair exonuclease SbcCD nuclease subunit
MALLLWTQRKIVSESLSKKRISGNMRIAVIGDPHFANRKLFGYPTEEPGVNTRLANIVNVFRWIRNDLPEDVTNVVILGDITHEHGKLTPPVLHAVYDALGAFGDMDAVYMLSGNHDLDHNGKSIATAFAHADGMFVFTPPMMSPWFVGHLTQLGMISYMDREATLLAFQDMLAYESAKKRIAFMHHHFEGAKHGAHEFEPPGGISPKDVPDEIDLVISGHYHLHHKINDKIIYCGVPLQHDFGEATYTPGYMLLDVDTLEYEFRETPVYIAPRFYIITPDVKKIPGDVGRDYYRVDFTTDTPVAELEKFKKKLTNVVFKALPITAEGRSRVSEVMEKEENLDINDIIEAYVKINATPDEVDELTKLGQELVLAGR